MTSSHRCSRAAFVVALALAAPLFAGSPALADGPPPSADPAKIEEAKKHMAAGAALYNDPSGHKCEEAYVEFNKAYELSGSLNALKNRAVCALELEKDGEALVDYKKVLAGMGDKLAADEKNQIENDMKALEAAVAWVTIKLDVPKAKITDVRTPSRGLPVTNRYDAANGVKIGFHPGSHALTATTEDGKEITWKVDLSNGSTQEHLFELNKPAPVPTATATATATATGEPTATATGEPTASVAPTSQPMPGLTKALLGATGGLAGAAAIFGGVMGGLALGAKGDYDKINVPGGSLADKQAKHDNVAQMNLMADIGFIGAGVAAVGFVVVLIVKPGKAAQPSTGFVVAPAITPNAGGFTAVGHF